MAEPLHLQPDPEPATEVIRLGNEVVEVPAEVADKLRNHYESLAAQYGAQLEEYRRQALQSVGTPQQPQQFQYQPPPEPDLGIPDPDLLFQNKQAWTDEFARNLEQKIGSVRGETTQLVQGLAQSVQQEFAKREAMQQAKAAHDAAMAQMLEQYELTDHTRVVQAIYNEQYDKLKHLPLEMALDKIGQEAVEEINRIRSGENWELGRSRTQTGVAPKPPRMLRSAQRASRAPAPQPPQEQGLLEAGGGLGMMGKIIRKRQASVLGGSSA